MGDLASSELNGTTEESLRAAVRSIVQEVISDPERLVADGDRLSEDLSLSSLGMLELAFALEDEFDLPAVDETTARKIITVKDLEDHVVAAKSRDGTITS